MSLDRPYSLALEATRRAERGEGTPAQCLVRLVLAQGPKLSAFHAKLLSERDDVQRGLDYAKEPR